MQQVQRVVSVNQETVWNGSLNLVYRFAKLSLFSCALKLCQYILTDSELLSYFADFGNDPTLLVLDNPSVVGKGPDSKPLVFRSTATKSPRTFRR